MKMKRFLLAVFLLCSLGATSQVKMRDLLRSMPDSIIPYLSTTNRLDCIDFKEAGMKAEVHNALDGKSELLSLSEHQADFQLNEAHRMQLQLLETGIPGDSCSQVLCVVDTYGKDIQESSIRFFSLGWHQLPTSDYMAVPQHIFTAVISSGKEHIELSLTPSDYTERPALEEQKPIEILPTKLKWINNSFK